MSDETDAEAPRQLILMRHAKADGGDTLLRDIDRPLNARGRRAALRMGRWMREEGLLPERVLSSPSVRTRQTVELVLGELGLDGQLVDWHDRIYEASPADLLAALAGVPDDCHCVLLVGHNPALETLLARLPREPPRLPAAGPLFPTAALAHLEIREPWAQLIPGTALLRRVARPRELSDD